jgi:hypothetical protein
MPRFDGHRLSPTIPSQTYRYFVAFAICKEKINLFGLAQLVFGFKVLPQAESKSISDNTSLPLDAMKNYDARARIKVQVGFSTHSKELEQQLSHN